MEKKKGKITAEIYGMYINNTLFTFSNKSVEKWL